MTAVVSTTLLRTFVSPVTTGLAHEESTANLANAREAEGDDQPGQTLVSIVPQHGQVLMRDRCRTRRRLSS